MAKTNIIVEIPVEWEKVFPLLPNVSWYSDGTKAVKPDIILGPNAHYFTEEMLANPKLLEAALKRARKAKKEKK
jgi:hypothetical protein